MYVVPLKGAIVEALRATFTATYPEPDFRGVDGAGLWCSIEYPVAQANYPGIWVTYDDTEELSIAGIDHTEIAVDDNGDEHEITRSRFGGVITMTCVALSSLERDRLYDELVRTLLFARKEPQVSAFRNLIETNDLVGMNCDFDKVRPSGDQAAPGTPWDTDEWIYEKSISVNVIGEFVSSYSMGGLVKLSAIRVRGYVDGTPEPAFTGNPLDDVLSPGLPGSTPHGFDAWVPGEWQ